MNRIIHAFFVIGAVIFSADYAKARRFDFKSASAATYLRGTYGSSALGKSAYGESSGAQTTKFSESVSTGFSGEFGLLFSGQTFNLRLGGEVILPSSASETKGLGASGDEYFNVASSLTAITPKATIEYVASQSPNSKVLLGLSAGYSFIGLENEYKFTAASPYSLSDFVEKGSGTAMLYEVSAAYELFLADNATMIIDAGYRYLKADSLEQKGNITSFQGVRSDRSPLINVDGSDRKLDLSGAFIGFGFRIYIGL